MADEQKLAKARSIFQLVCQAMDAEHWTYKADPEKMTAELKVRGDDLLVELTFVVDADRQVLTLISVLPSRFSAEKRVEGAMAVSAVTYKLLIGGFDYNIENGRVSFRANAAFMGCDVEVEKISHMMHYTIAVVDEYNDKFLAFDKGYITMAELLA